MNQSELGTAEPEAQAIDLSGALVARYRERLTELRSDDDAVAWGGLRFEAALDVLGEDVSSEAINALLHAAMVHPWAK